MFRSSVRRRVYPIPDSRHTGLSVSIDLKYGIVLNIHTCFLSTILAGRTRSTSAPSASRAFTFSSATSSGIIIAVTNGKSIQILIAWRTTNWNRSLFEYN